MTHRFEGVCIGGLVDGKYLAHNSPHYLAREFSSHPPIHYPILDNPRDLEYKDYWYTWWEFPRFSAGIWVYDQLTLELAFRRLAEGFHRWIKEQEEQE